jgi:hypothetical protein
MFHVTGYDRVEVMNRNCKFLQNNNHGCPKQASSLERIQFALKSQKPLKPTFLTNFTKNGHSFVNLLTMKPIFNQRNNYCYVIALQHRLQIPSLDDLTMT